MTEHMEKASHSEHHAIGTVSAEKTVDHELNENARIASDAEHQLSALQAVRLYPKAVAWCLLVSMCVIMEGFDTNLMGNFFAYPEFAKRYGSYYQQSNNYQLTAPWQAGLSQASGVGSFFGTLLNGYLVSRFGQIRVLISALVSLSGFIFIVFFAQNVETLLVGEFLCGFPWGIFATSAPAYASEVLPMSLRVYLTSWTNMCFIIGQLISAGVMAGLVNNPSEWAYRVPFAMQWIWPAFLIPALFWAPETPWHLVRKDRFEAAEISLRRLRSNATDAEIKGTLALIMHTNRLEEQLKVGTSYWDCFKGFELRRTEIACVVFAGQVLSGLNFAYNSTYFFQQVGLSPTQGYDLNVGGNGLALFGTLVSWFLIMPYFGRRTAYVWGMGAMSAVLLVIGILNVWADNKQVAMAQAVLTLCWTFLFQLSAGQLGWALPAEVGSTRLRQKTVCLARNAYAITSVVAGVLEPYFISPLQWNLKGYVGFVWGGTAFATFVWAYFRLPETKGRTYEELDLLFAKKVSARKFSSYQVDVFNREDGADAVTEYI